MQAYFDGAFQWVSLLFLVMMVVPYVLLSRFGRMSIGLIRPGKPQRLLFCFSGGVLIATLIYFLGQVMYGDSLQNWFVYISQSYAGQRQLDNPDLAFGMVALVTMTFSPIGEELFYRGVVHQAFVRRFGENGASRVDSIAFALTHLAHFGLVYASGIWTFYPLPALLWVGAMFIVSRLFFMCKLGSGSIWGAVVAHAGFNLGMSYFIWYWTLGN